MATVYPDIRIVQDVYNVFRVVLKISIFIVPVASLNRNVRHTGSDAITKDV